MTTPGWAAPLAILIVSLIPCHNCSNEGVIAITPWKDDDKTKTTFTIFKPSNPGRGSLIMHNELDLLNQLIGGTSNRKLPLKIIVHGFMSNDEADWVLKMKDALIHRMDCYVITVDWRVGAKGLSYINDKWGFRLTEIPLYSKAVENSYIVGEQIAQLLLALEHLNFDISEAHIIGHSLGGHVAGEAGRKVRGRLGRITGLDPAGPSFSNVDPSRRLDASDAKFVDVIHTAIKSFGIVQPSGHVDFYPNGGYLQPGCGLNFLCNHAMAHKFFTSSIYVSLPGLRDATCLYFSKPCRTWDAFITHRCRNPCSSSNPCQEMGLKADNYTSRGSMFLLTSEIEPYCGLSISSD